MFDPNCIKELFRPQRALTIKSLRVVFGRLAHASIMKLNNSAMDKVTCENDSNAHIVVCFILFFQAL